MEQQEFLRDKKDILKKVGEQLGKKVYDGEVVKKNEHYIKLEESVPFWRNEIPNLRIDVSQIFTLVEKQKGYYLKIQPYISLHLPDLSVIRFSPHMEDALEISRIQTPQIGIGHGTMLMEMFFSIVRGTLDFVPMIWLECTGAVGINQTEQNYGIANQTRFFRKFGFRVKDRSKYPKWVDMIRPAEVPPSTPLPF
jgi:hypothetical protein